MTIYEQNEQLTISVENALIEFNRLRTNGIGVDAKTFFTIKKTLKQVKEPDPIDIEFVRRKVCEYYIRRTDVCNLLRKLRFEVSAEGLSRMMNSRRKLHPLPEIRRTFWHFAKLKLGTPLMELARITGKRDHSTIIYGIDSYSDLMYWDKTLQQTDKTFRQIFEID